MIQINLFAGQEFAEVENRHVDTEWEEGETNWESSIDMYTLLLLSCFGRVRLCVNPIDGSPPGSPVPGILQARTLE